MTAAAVMNLGKVNSRQIDWEAVARALGHVDKAEYLADVCKNTMWRKKPGRKATRVIEFTATGRGSGGKPIEALGSHLILATVNLVAPKKEQQVNRW